MPVNVSVALLIVAVPTVIRRPELKRRRGIDHRSSGTGLLEVLDLTVQKAGHVLGEAGGSGDEEREKEERPTCGGTMWTVGFHARQS